MDVGLSFVVSFLSCFFLVGVVVPPCRLQKSQYHKKRRPNFKQVVGHFFSLFAFQVSFFSPCVSNVFSCVSCFSQLFTFFPLPLFFFFSIYLILIMCSCVLVELLKFTPVVVNDTTLHGVHTDTTAFSPSVLIMCTICSYQQSLTRTPHEWLQKAIHGI